MGAGGESSVIAPVAPVVVFAVGNPSRGDDALGPRVCGRLEKWLEIAGLADRVELIEDFQLNIEHALDLVGRKLALFIDAGDRTPAPFVFEQIFPSTAVAHTSHALEPSAVLQVYRLVQQAEPPPSFVLCIRGEAFELGAPVGEAAADCAEAALELLQRLLPETDVATWLAAQTAGTGKASSGESRHAA